MFLGLNLNIIQFEFAEITNLHLIAVNVMGKYKSLALFSFLTYSRCIVYHAYNAAHVEKLENWLFILI